MSMLDTNKQHFAQGFRYRLDVSTRFGGTCEPRLAVTRIDALRRKSDIEKDGTRLVRAFKFRENGKQTPVKLY